MAKAENKFVLDINFAGRKISLDKALAKKYALLGLKAEKYSLSLEILKLLAAREKKSPEEFMQDLKKEKDDALKSSLLEKVGGDEDLAEKLFNLENDSAGKFKTKKKGDFEEINEYFSNYKTADDLPDEVLILSELKGISLFDSLLRYKLLQHQKAEKEQKNREKNMQKGVGSLQTNDTDYGFSYISAMLRGINN